MKRIMMSRAGVIGMLALTCLAVWSPPATATFPGDNGRIAFRRFLNTEQTVGRGFHRQPRRQPRGAGHPPARRVRRPQPGRLPGRAADRLRAGESDCGDTCFVDDIFVVDADGTGLTQLTGTGSPNGNCLPPDSGLECNGSPAWSPDGRRSRSPALRSGRRRPRRATAIALFMNAHDGSHVRQITPARPPATGAQDTEPQWSPDGRTLLFQRRNVRTAEPAEHGWPSGR